MIYNDKEHIKNISTLLIRNEFGEKLEHFIAEKGTNKNELANEMSVTHTTVERYINGFPPKKSYAIRLCIALNLTRDETIELLASAGIVFSKNSNRDIVFDYIIKNIDFKKATVTDINILIDNLIEKNQNNYKNKRIIDHIELI